MAAVEAAGAFCPSSSLVVVVLLLLMPNKHCIKPARSMTLPTFSKAKAAATRVSQRLRNRKPAIRQSRSICGVVGEEVGDEDDEAVVAAEEEDRSLAMSARRPAAMAACCGEAVTSVVSGLRVSGGRSEGMTTTMGDPGERGEHIPSPTLTGQKLQ